MPIPSIPFIPSITHISSIPPLPPIPQIQSIPFIQNNNPNPSGKKNLLNLYESIKEFHQNLCPTRGTEGILCVHTAITRRLLDGVSYACTLRSQDDCWMESRMRAHCDHKMNVGRSKCGASSSHSIHSIHHTHFIHHIPSAHSTTPIDSIHSTQLIHSIK